MGEALSRTLVSHGWIVAMADIKPNQALSDELGTQARFYETNVASYDSQAATFLEVWKDFGRIDALCANAGIVDRDSPYLFRHRDRSAEDVPPAPDLTCTDVDWKGVVYGTQLCVHFMRHNSPPGGSIVATASVAAVHPHECFPEYNGAKAAVLQWVRGTARLLKNKENIRINCILPGIVPTTIIPPAMIAAVQPPEWLTPIKTITDAYVRFLDDESLYGEAIEGSRDQHVFVAKPVFGDGEVTKRAATVWDPLFEVMHGEWSGLDDAIPGESLLK